MRHAVLDEFLVATDDENVAIGVVISLVTCVEPPVADRLGRFLKKKVDRKIVPLIYNRKIVRHANSLSAGSGTLSSNKVCGCRSHPLGPPAASLRSQRQSPADQAFK